MNEQNYYGLNPSFNLKELLSADYPINYLDKYLGEPENSQQENDD